MKSGGSWAVFFTAYRTYIEYENGDLFVASHNGTKEHKQFACTLAAFLGIYAYKDEGSQELKKLPGQWKGSSVEAEPFASNA